MCEPNDHFTVSCSNKYIARNPVEQTNTPADFYTYFPEILRLDDDYHVSLAEISFTKTWKNINTEQVIRLPYGSPSNEEHSVVLGEGNYDSIKDFLEVLNQLMTEFRNEYIEFPPRFEMNETNGKITLFAAIRNELYKDTYSDIYILPIMSNKLCEILGFVMSESEGYSQDGQSITISGSGQETVSVESKGSYDLLKIRHFEVYADIIEPTIVGNEMKKLLARIEIPADSQYGQTVVVIPDQKIYHKLSILEFDNISIQIREESGRLIDFDEKDKTVVTLHFKKKQCQQLN